jgi:hypothetical protein
MRSLALLCLLVFATPAHAAGPEQHYLDLRDRYIAKFSKAKENDETYKQHDTALKELTGVLRGVVGPVTIKGLPADGKTNADTLFKGDSGFGHLDGLGFASEGDKMQAVATTTGLLKQCASTARTTCHRRLAPPSSRTASTIRRSRTRPSPNMPSCRSRSPRAQARRSRYWASAAMVI